jgi:hypothetical protein
MKLNVELSDYEIEIILKVLNEFVYFSKQEIELEIYTNDIDLKNIEKIIKKIKSKI